MAISSSNVPLHLMAHALRQESCEPADFFQQPMPYCSTSHTDLISQFPEPSLFELSNSNTQLQFSPLPEQAKASIVPQDWPSTSVQYFKEEPLKHKAPLAPQLAELAAAWPDVLFESLTDAEKLLSEFGSPEEHIFLGVSSPQPVLPQDVPNSLPQAQQLDSIFADAFPGAGPSDAGSDPHSQQSEQLAMPLPGMADRGQARKAKAKRKAASLDASSEDYDYEAEQESPGYQAPPKRQRGNARATSRPTFGDTMTEGQRAKARETARRLRQRKAEALEQLQADVAVLTDENRKLLKDLKGSINFFDDVQQRNNKLKQLLRCLQVEPSLDNVCPELRVLMNTKARITKHDYPEQQREAQTQAVDLAAATLMEHGGQAGAALQQLVGMVVSQPLPQDC